MRHPFTPCLIVILSLGLTCPTAAAAQVSTHLHVLLAIDTDARAANGIEGIGTVRDLEIWSDVIGEIRQGREARVSVTVVKGRDLTPDTILNFYRQLGQRPGWALLFVYSGHGAIGGDGEHYLTFTHGGNLGRSRLREVMEGTGANLQVILTDCCGSVAPFDAPRRQVPAEWAMFEQLFFETGGMVDVLSCEMGAESFGNDRVGGMFTRACTGLLCSPVSVSDGDRDGRVTWPEFFDRLRADTQQIAANAGKRQVPARWYLGGRQRFDDVLADAQACLRQVQPQLDALVTRASQATRIRSRSQAVHEVRNCILTMTGFATDVGSRAQRAVMVVRAASRSGVADDECITAATESLAQVTAAVTHYAASVRRMQDWMRQAVATQSPSICR